MSCRYSDRPQFMDPSIYRSSVQNLSYVQDHNSTPISPRTLPRLVERHEEDYFSLSRDERLETTYSVRTPLDRAIYEKATILSDAEHIRSRNIQVQLANAALTSVSGYAEIHPKICPSGRYPIYFHMPMQLNQLVNLDNIQLQRILADYDIHTSGSSNRGASRLDEICALLEYLGAMTVSRLLRGGQRRTGSVRR